MVCAAATGGQRIQVVERRLPAHAAGSGGGEPPCEHLGIDRLSEIDDDDVVVAAAVAGRAAMANRAHVIGVDETLGEEEAGRELEVVAGGAHRDGRAHGSLVRPGHADLERLLGRQPIGTLLAETRPHRHDRGRTHRAA
jgi:hypothetical protein